MSEAHENVIAAIDTTEKTVAPPIQSTHNSQSDPNDLLSSSRAASQALALQQRMAATGLDFSNAKPLAPTSTKKSPPLKPKGI